MKKNKLKKLTHKDNEHEKEKLLLAVLYQIRNQQF